MPPGGVVRRLRAIASGAVPGVLLGVVVMRLFESGHVLAGVLLVLAVALVVGCWAAWALSDAGLDAAYYRQQRRERRRQERRMTR